MSDKRTDKHPGGRPRMYKNPEDMQIAIDDYFENEVGVEAYTDKEGKPVCDNKGKPMFKIKPASITGLALHLGFNSRQSLLNYEGYNDKFMDTIKKGKARVERYIEEGMSTGQLSGVPCIFNLKNNFGWKDRQEIDHSGGITVNLGEDKENPL